MFNMNYKSRKYQESTIYVENMSQIVLKTICKKNSDKKSSCTNTIFFKNP